MIITEHATILAVIVSFLASRTFGGRFPALSASSGTCFTTLRLDIVVLVGILTGLAAGQAGALLAAGATLIAVTLDIGEEITQSTSVALFSLFAAITICTALLATRSFVDVHLVLLTRDAPLFEVAGVAALSTVEAVALFVAHGFLLAAVAGDTVST